MTPQPAGAGQPISVEIQQSIRGAIVLLNGKQDSLSNFNLTLDGFWRSFVAALLAFPVEIGLTLMQTDRYQEASSSLSFAFTELLGYSVGWILFPLIAIVTTRFFNLESRYVTYVIVNNWIRLVQIVAVSAVLMVLGADALANIWVMVIITVLFYDYVATRVSLGASVGVSFGLVIFNAMIALLVQSVVIQFLW